MESSPSHFLAACQRLARCRKLSRRVSNRAHRRRRTHLLKTYAVPATNAVLATQPPSISVLVLLVWFQEAGHFPLPHAHSFRHFMPRREVTSVTHQEGRRIRLQVGCWHQGGLGRNQEPRVPVRTVPNRSAFRGSLMVLHYKNCPEMLKVKDQPLLTTEQPHSKADAYLPGPALHVA